MIHVKPESSTLPVEQKTAVTVGQDQPTPQFGLIEMALNKGASMDTIERLVALYENEQKKKQFKAFHEAMSEFQSELTTIERNKKGYEGYQYADIDQIVKTIKPLLRKWGFTYRYEYEDVPTKTLDFTDMIARITEAVKKYLASDKLKIDGFENIMFKILSNRELKVTCVVTHREGHSERTTMTGPEDYSGFKTLIQSRGSSVTYLERYTLKGAFGLTSADSDNINDKKKQAPPAEQPKKEEKKATPTKPAMSDEQFNKAFIRISKQHEDILQNCKDAYALSEKQLKGLESADELRKQHEANQKKD